MEISNSYVERQDLKETKKGSEGIRRYIVETECEYAESKKKNKRS